jgi:hypothetical protein
VKVAPTRPETSVNYHSMPRNIPEERRSQNLVCPQMAQVRNKVRKKKPFNWSSNSNGPHTNTHAQYGDPINILFLWFREQYRLKTWTNTHASTGLTRDLGIEVPKTSALFQALLQ